MVIFSCVVKESKRQKRERFFFPKGKERKGKERKERVMAFFFVFVCLSDVFSLFFFFVLFVSKATHEDEREREKKKEIVRS